MKMKKKKCCCNSSVIVKISLYTCLILFIGSFIFLVLDVFEADCYKSQTQANIILWNFTLTTPTSCDDLLNDSFNSTELELKVLIRAFKDCQECTDKASLKSVTPLLVLGSTLFLLLIIANASIIKGICKSGKLCQIIRNRTAMRRGYISYTDEREPRVNRVNSQRRSNEGNSNVEDDERSIGDDSDTYITPAKKSNNGPDVDRGNGLQMEILKE